jgi:GNAT superfamily N-acetyltransferase
MSGDLIERIVHTENLFPQTFADVEERDWGVLFVTPTIPDSYDGNHACVLSRGCDPAAVVEEIITFYQGRGLTPRVNYVAADGDHPQLRQALRGAGFTIGYEDDMQMYLYQGPSRIEPNPAVQTRRIDSVDGQMLEALAAVENQRMAGVVQRRSSRPDGWLFVGEVAGEVASVGLMERVAHTCRVDELHTAQRHRRKGCARAVVHAMVTWYERAQIHEPLYLWPASPLAARIYVDAGFVKLEHSFTSWSAWRERPEPQDGGGG